LVRHESTLATGSQEPLFPVEPTGRVSVSVYVATPLSGLPREDQRQLESWCANLRDAVVLEIQQGEGWDIHLHIPIEVSPPWVEDNRTASDIYDLNTAAVWSDADGLILFAYKGGSLGAGQELAWACGLRMPVLMLHLDGVLISRQMRGTEEVHAHMEIAAFKNVPELRSVVTNWLRRHRVELEAHQRRRQLQRGRIAGLQQVLKQSWQAVERDDDAGALELASMSERRVERLVDDPDALLLASVDEVLALASALDLDVGAAMTDSRRRPLESRELMALRQVAREEEWTGARVAELVSHAQKEVAAGATRRMSLGSQDGWIELERRMEAG
jgi:hypothetical protein